MRIFKRFALYALCVALLSAAVCAAFIVPWLRTPTEYHDQAQRKALAGQIDTLVIGASYSLDSVMPEKLDARLGTTTYNLCGSMMPVYGQTFMIRKELARNPVKTMLIELTPDTLTTHERETDGNGDTYIYARLDSPAERIAYLAQCACPGDWGNVLCRSLILSMRSMAYRLLGRMELLDPSKRGFNPTKARDVSLSADEAKGTWQAMSMFYDLQEENIRELDELVRLSMEGERQVVLIYPPVSHGKLWQLNDHDQFLAWAQAYCGERGLTFFDFNLLKEKYALFSDADSFSDVSHLSEGGAERFSEAMADVLARWGSGEDVSGLFYESYAQMLTDSPYWAYME